jgi:prepilin peptidase CpaA
MEPLLELETWRTLLVLLPLAVALCVSAVWDAMERKIPNVVTYPAFGVGLVVHAVAWGWWGLAWALGAAVTTLLVGIVLMIGGVMGGGDVKLLTATAAFLGFGGLGEVLFYAVWIGFLLGVVLAIANRYVWEMFARMGRWLRGLFRWAVYRTDQVAESLETDERSEVPFGVAIFLGFVLAYTEAASGWPGWIDWFFRMSQ